MSYEKPLFIHHVEHPMFGEVKNWAMQKSLSFDSLYAPGLSLPDNPCGPVIIFGGPMSVNDNLSWIKHELLWIEKLLKDNHPLFGICLGGQMIAKVLGQDIVSCKKKHVECGYSDIHSSTISLKKVYQWHSEGFSSNFKNSDVDILATSPWNESSTQAFKYKNAIGTQFHPEVDEEIIKRWLKRDKHFLSLNGSSPSKNHLLDHKIHSPKVKTWLYETLDHLIMVK